MNLVFRRVVFLATKPSEDLNLIIGGERFEFDWCPTLSTSHERATSQLTSLEQNISIRDTEPMRIM